MSKIVISGPSIGGLFSNTVKEIRQSFPFGATGAIDLKMSFKSVELSTEGIGFIYVKKSETSSSMEIELATRIHTDDLVRPTEAEIVLFVQSQAAKDAAYEGPLDGVRTIALDDSIDRALAKIRAAATAGNNNLLIAALNRLKDSDRRLVGYLQHVLKMVPEDIDGIFGPKTEHAFVMNRIEYSITRK